MKIPTQAPKIITEKAKNMGWTVSQHLSMEYCYNSKNKASRSRYHHVGVSIGPMSDLPRYACSVPPQDGEVKLVELLNSRRTAFPHQRARTLVAG